MEYNVLVFKSNENDVYFYCFFFTINISWLITEKTVYINFTSLGNIMNI